jgi:hypothetical protein
VFTKLLPRDESSRERCETCERQVGRHEGPQAAPQIPFAARGIAGALVAVGGGATYEHAARRGGPCRQRAALRPADCAGAPLARDRGLPLRVAPSSRARATDEHRAPAQPSDPPKRSTRSSRASSVPSTVATFWRPFVRKVRAAGIEALDLWLDEMDPVIEGQFARRGSASRRPAVIPLSIRRLEQLVRPIKDALYRRRLALKNRERLNRLLQLMQLRLNGLDDQTTYATAFATGSSPATAARGVRRAITDSRRPLR